MFIVPASLSRNLLGAFGTVVFAGICLMGATAPAQASETPRSTIVRTADLNLATDAGRSTLAGRVRTAARAVCSGAADDLRGKQRTAGCVKSAVASAQPARMASIN
jgi:UrcA family protein